MGRLTTICLVLGLAAACTPAVGSADPAALVNDYRTRQGLPALQRSAELTAGAQVWASHLADTRALSHDVLSLTPGWAALAENVGFGASVENIQAGFEASPLHEHNLVGPYTHLGVATAARGDIVWVVQRFGARAPAATTTAPPTTTGAPVTTITSTATTTTTRGCQ